MRSTFPDVYFLNKVIDKSELKKLITWAFSGFGIARASNMADVLKDIGFLYATRGGISLSLEDLRIPPNKSILLSATFQSIKKTDLRYQRGEITAVERFQKVIDTWNYASDNLKQEVIEYFKNTDPLNSIYIMAFSGARANISQVKQLVGMRGLMADPQGQIIDLPIFRNFREGLTITDYFISSYGARKGLVDTALRTADSGYLTRRLVDVSQDVIVREYDCKTDSGILLEEMTNNNKVLISFKQALVGRVLAEHVFHPIENYSIGRSNQIIDNLMADKIIKANLHNILVRSPLTCKSLKSVCQLCYGWSLAHSKLVDLGEAVGIIAAQSIGEPGTQLTMRTFHTGGVFTGQLSNNIVADMDGCMRYPEGLTFTRTRNRYGDYVNIAHSDCTLTIVNKKEISKNFSVPKRSLIVVKNDSYVQKGQVIAEYPIINQLSTEKARKSVVTNFSGSVHFSFSNHNNKLMNGSVDANMVIWVLSGEVYHLPADSKLLVSNSDVVSKNSLIATTKLLSNYNGKIYVVKDKMMLSRLLLVTSSKLYTNLKIYLDTTSNYRKYFLETERGDRFLLRCKPNKKIVDKQIIGDLVSSAYKTTSGGIIKYLDLVLSPVEGDNLYNIHGSGYILWIPEETHVINKDLSMLLVNNNRIVESGTEIFQNIFANNSGFLEVLEKDGIIREVIIKPGHIHKIMCKDFKVLSKQRGFLRPGEYIAGSITTNKLVYWEYLSIDGSHFIFLRPVIIYSVPEKKLHLRCSESSFSIEKVNLKLARRTNFRDGERIKSVVGINLVATHLIAEIDQEILHLKCYIQLYYPSNASRNTYYFIKFITADFLTVRDSYLNRDGNLYTETSILAKDGDYIKSGSIISRTNIFSSTSGYVAYIENKQANGRRMLLVGDPDIRIFSISNPESLKVRVNSWVYVGDEISHNLFSSYSGRVIQVEDDRVVLRIGQPHLISYGSIVHIADNSIIQKGESIATLIFDTFKTGDIIQGLPRIEEILEARKKYETSFNPHLILEAKFLSYMIQGIGRYNSTRLSLIEIQSLLIKEIQLVYQSQGVYISDKHIEVIIKQMTSKVKIQNGGETDYLPGELVDLQKIESINKSLLLLGKKQASYYPILLGITKASLNTDSFVSAASFQETTKVLTEAAVYGRSDWLRGLKENVIIGRLIPAGTGFGNYNSKNVHNDIYSKISFVGDKEISDSKFCHSTQGAYFEDIIVDDRMSN